jgi:hypothetical protein
MSKKFELILSNVSGSKSWRAKDRKEVNAKFMANWRDFNKCQVLEYINGNPVDITKRYPRFLQFLGK